MANKELLYETTFHNKAKDTWTVRERNNAVLCVVRAGDKVRIVAYKPTAFWSRYKEATRNKDGKIETKVNKHWESPWREEYSVELNNLDKVQHGVRFNAGNPCATPSGAVHVEAGMTNVLVPCAVTDPQVKFRKITWRRGDVELPLRGTRYFVYETQIVREDELRSADEIQAIIERRAEMARAEALKMAEAKMEIVKRQLLGEADAPQEA